MTETPSSAQQEPPHHYDDEISLVDLAKILIDKKWWILGVGALVTLAALAFALSKEHSYRYTSTLLVGEFGLEKYVTKAAVTQSELQNRYLPQAEAALLEESGLEELPFKTEVEAHENGSFVQVHTEATEASASLIPDFHQSLFQPVIQDHNDKIELFIKESDTKLETMREALKTKQAQLERLLALKEGLATRQIQEQGASRPEVKAEGSVGRLSTKLSSDEQDLTVLLSNLQINEEISKLESAINNLEGNIQAEELKRSWIKQTRIDGLANRSRKPVGTGRGVIVVLGVLLGGMLGIFAAFLAHFVQNVRTAIRENDGIEAK